MTGHDMHFVSEPEAVARLHAFGVPYPEHGLARNAAEAGDMASRLGCPVVLKIVSGDLPHKSDVGGVALGIRDCAEAARTFESMTARVRGAAPGAHIEGVLVCREAPPGVEVIVGVSRDPVFGPTVMLGMGGVFAEILHDVTFRIAPLDHRDAGEMIREVRGAPLLFGARGRPPCDVTALADLLVSVSRLAATHDGVQELDLNPVRVYPSGLLALDVRLIERAP